MRKIAALLLAALLVACDPGAITGAPMDRGNANGEESQGSQVATDKNTYGFNPGANGPELTIVSTFHAPADASVQLANCNGAFPWRLERLDANGWSTAWVPTMDACLSAPILIRKGAVYSSSLVIRRGAGTASQAGFDGRELTSGTYRLVWDGLTDISGMQLEEAARVSEPFVISQ